MNFLYMYYVREEQERKIIHVCDMANSSFVEGAVACDIAVVILIDGSLETSIAWGLAYVPIFVVKLCGYCFKSLHCYRVDTKWSFIRIYKCTKKRMTNNNNSMKCNPLQLISILKWLLILPNFKALLMILSQTSTKTSQ